MDSVPILSDQALYLNVATFGLILNNLSTKLAIHKHRKQYTI